MTVGRTALDDGRIELVFLSPDEAEEITEIAFPLFREVYRETPSEIVEAFLQETQTPESIRRQMASGTIYAFINYDGERAGYIAYEKCSEGMRLSKLYLFGEYRGKGIGGRLLTFVEGEARKAGIGLIRLEVNEINPSAREFYLSHGYSVEERIDYMRVVMRKKLDDRIRFVKIDSTMSARYVVRDVFFSCHAIRDQIRGSGTDHGKGVQQTGLRGNTRTHRQ